MGRIRYDAGVGPTGGPAKARRGPFMSRIESPPTPTWAALLAFGLASRVLVVAAGLMLARAPVPEKFRPDQRGDDPSRLVSGRQLEALDRPGRAWVAPWYRWDALWYAEVFTDGYAYVEGEMCTAGFLPALPLVMAGADRLGLDPYVAGLVVPNLAFAVGLACFGRLAARVGGDPGTAWRACILLAAYPWSLFGSAPYGESLGLACSAAAALAWVSGRPGRAALLYAPATAARLPASALSVALVLEWLEAVVRGKPARWAAWPVALAGGLGVGLFYLYLGLTLGDPLASLRAHGAWGREPASLGGIVRVLTLPPWRLRGHELHSYAAMVGFLALGLRAWRRRGAFWGALILTPILQAMATGSLLSLARVALLSYPAFLEGAELLRDRRAFALAVALMLGVQLLAIDRYVNFLFVG